MAEKIIEISHNNFAICEKISSFEDTLQALISLAPTDFPLLPKGTRYYQKIDDYELVVIEQPPMVRNIKCYDILDENEKKDMGYGDEPKNFKLAFPYVIFVLMYENSHLESGLVFYRTKPLKSLDDQIYKVNLPHISYYNFEICDSGMMIKKTTSFSDKVESYISAFWNSIFCTYDDTDHLFHQGKNLDRHLYSFKTWQRASKKSPKFMLKVDWNKFGSLNEAIQKMLELHAYNGSEYADDIIIEDEEKIADLIYQCREVKMPKIPAPIILKAKRKNYVR